MSFVAYYLMVRYQPKGALNMGTKVLLAIYLAILSHAAWGADGEGPYKALDNWLFGRGSGTPSQNQSSWHASIGERLISDAAGISILACHAGGELSIVNVRGGILRVGPGDKFVIELGSTKKEIMLVNTKNCRGEFKSL
jgi:hypothetical protein